MVCVFILIFGGVLGGRVMNDCVGGVAASDGVSMAVDECIGVLVGVPGVVVVDIGVVISIVVIVVVVGVHAIHLVGGHSGGSSQRRSGRNGIRSRISGFSIVVVIGGANGGSRGHRNFVIR